MRLLPGSSRQFGPPRRFSASTADWLKGRPANGRFIPLSAGKHTTRTPAIHADKPMSSLLDSIRTGTTRPRFVADLQDCRLWGLGYQVLVASHDYESWREVDLLRAIVERGVDGIVLIGTDHADSVYDLQRQYGLPYVLSWAVDETRAGHCVGFSYRDAAHAMANLVVERGHTRIALCPGIADGNERVRARIEGTRAALRSHGLVLRDDWIVETPFTFEGGRRAVAQLFQSSDRPTVLICGTDIQAVGAIGECRSRGLVVPDELSITGSDDIELASLVEPKLTTVHVPTAEIGRLSAERIVDLIEGRTQGATHALQTTLVERDSLSNIARKVGEPSSRHRKEKQA